MLQPTHTPGQKRIGGVTHGILNGLALACFTTAVLIIIVNKNNHHAAHFTTAHGRIGLTTYILLILQVQFRLGVSLTQTSVGIAMFYLPTKIFGSVERGKAIYKYHRASGYVVWTLVLVNCVLGTQSTWFTEVWDNTWVWVVLAMLAFLSMVSRIRPNKMKFF